MSVGGVNYVIPQELQGGSIPETTVRGDSREPSIIFQEGFAPRQNGTVNRDTLQDYAANNTPGPYVSTSRSEDVAEQFAGDNGYVYRVDVPQDRAIDVNHALGSDSPFPDEEEIAVAGGVAGSDIIDARNVDTGEVFKNPNYNPEPSPPPPPNPNAPAPHSGTTREEGDLIKRRRLEEEEVDDQAVAGSGEEIDNQDGGPPDETVNGQDAAPPDENADDQATASTSGNADALPQQ